MRLTENGEHGATTMRRIAKRAGSCQRSISRCVSFRIAGSASTTWSGGRPPWLWPTLIEPRAAWKRMPISVAASMLSSSVTPLG
ncbi:hypothetical protein X551_04541 [Methylibium sp. T29]|nr:hypothetical protein X551_04541 [Methylibium sp. T29]